MIGTLTDQIRVPSHFLQMFRIRIIFSGSDLGKWQYYGKETIGRYAVLSAFAKHTSLPEVKIDLDR
jgi:hypothetical protein